MIWSQFSLILRKILDIDTTKNWKKIEEYKHNAVHIMGIRGMDEMRDRKQYNYL